MTPPRPLRPLERRVTKLAESGVGQTEIARRFRRSPEMINRIITMAALPVGGAGLARPRQLLRPLERRVLHLRQSGVDYGEIGARFKRSVASVQQVERLARYKVGRG